MSSGDALAPPRPLVIHSLDYPPNHGGIARLCAEVARGLALRGQPVRVISQHFDTHDGAQDVPVHPLIDDRRVTDKRPQRESQALLELAKARAQQLPVVTGCWYPEGLLAAATVAKGPRPSPHIILAHGLELMPPPERWRRDVWPYLLRRTLESATLVIANSEYTGRLVRKVAPAAQVTAIPLGVDERRFTPIGREQAKEAFGVTGKRVIATVARVVAYKAHDLVLRAIATLHPEVRKDFVYLVAGRGPNLDALKQLAQTLGIAEQVRWLGFVAEADLPNLYRASDLFVLATRESTTAQEVEGFGLVFLEAQACGTPVVGARTGGIPDAIKHGEGGFLIAQDDLGALALLLERLAMDPAFFVSEGARARTRVEREGTWSTYVDRFAAALASVGVRTVGAGQSASQGSNP